MLLGSPHSLWREVQDAAGGLPSSVPTLCHRSTRSPSLPLAKTDVVRSRYWWVSIHRTATVFAFEIQMTKTRALFLEEISVYAELVKFMTWKFLGPRSGL